MLPSGGSRFSPWLRANCRNTVNRVRQYAAAVPLTEVLDESLKSAGKAQPLEVKVTKLDNGIRVASAENFGGITRLGVVIDAGTRHESPSQLGITHFLRNASFLTTQDRSGFRIVREIQQQGATLDTVTTREHFLYNSTALRDKIPIILDNIASGINGPLFQPWEIDDAIRLTNLDRANLEVNTQSYVLDELHRVAYRKSLGNSLFCPQDRIGKFSQEELQEYVKNNFVGERISVVALGYDNDELVDLVKSALGSLPRGKPAQEAVQKYHGGEVHSRTGAGLVHAAVVAEGAGFNHKDLLKFGVLQRVMGVTPFIKWGSHTVSSRLNKAVMKVTDAPFMASALNTSYSDSGLFGFYAISGARNTGQVLKAAAAEFGNVAKGDLKSEQFERAKNQLKASIMMTSEDHDALVEDISSQVLMKGTYISPQEACAQVDKIIPDDVIAIAKKMFVGKPSLAVAGDTSSAPYLDDLF